MIGSGIGEKVVVGGVDGNLIMLIAKCYCCSGNANGLLYCCKWNDCWIGFGYCIWWHFEDGW